MYRTSLLLSLAVVIVAGPSPASPPESTTRVRSPQKTDTQKTDTEAASKLSFKPDAQVRIRFELDGGRDLVDGELTERFGQVVRLGGTLSYADRVTVVARLQDVRTWGEETNTLLDFSGDSIDLHEGYLRVVALDGPITLALEAGRSAWAYDEQRLIGRVGWTLQERRFDGVRLRAKADRWSADLFYAKTTESDIAESDIAESDSAASHDTDVFGAHAHVQLGTVRIAALLIADLQDALERDRVTAGVHVRGRPAWVHYRLEGYVQAGSQKAADPATSEDMDILAWMVGGELGAHGKAPIGWSVSLGADALSGEEKPDGAASTDAIGAFDTLFATNHAYYGLSDFFLNVPVHTGRRGLLDAYAKVKIAPHQLVGLQLQYHHLRLLHPDDGDDQHLGDEVSAVVVWRPWKVLTVLAGGAAMIPGPALTRIRGGGEDIEPWFFVETNARF